MEFFRELSRIGNGFKKVTITIMEKDGKQTVSFIPETGNEKVNRKLIPVILSGTPMEVDEGFFPNIIQTVEVVTGLTSNIEQVKEKAAATDTEKAEEEDDDEKAEKKPAAKSKNKPKKKVAAKKKPAASTNGPNSETDKHHQADMKETEVKDAQEQLTF